MLAGQRVGKYVLGDQIARGGMAEVWGARVEGPGGFVKSLALKFILESFAGDAELERLFVNEARVAARLQHANLVSVFDFDKMSDDPSGGLARYYIAMERVDGHDLRRVLQVGRHKNQHIPLGIALFIAGEVLKGLRYVHEWREQWDQQPLGLVHRDVSPHNILVGWGGEVKLSDFGIAKATTQSLGTQSGMIRGKLAYASPEQLRSEPVDHRADQFGLGVTLWEMLADRRLFDGTSEMEIVAQVLRCHIPSLQKDGVGVGAAVDKVVRRMLASRPEDRFPSTAEALSAVVAAPGYVSDAAAGLVEMMRQLFAAPIVGVPPTVPLNLKDPPRASSMAVTSELDRSPRSDGAGADAGADAAVAGSASAEAPGPAQSGSGSRTRPGRLALDARGLRSPSLSRQGQGQEASDAIPVSVDPSEAVTGSAYVSDHSLVIPPSLARHRGPRQLRRTVGALLVVTTFAVGGGALFLRRHAGSMDDPEGDTGSEIERAGAAAPRPFRDSARSVAGSQPTREAAAAAGAPAAASTSPTAVAPPGGSEGAGESPAGRLEAAEASDPPSSGTGLPKRSRRPSRRNRVAPISEPSVAERAPAASTTPPPKDAAPKREPPAAPASRSKDAVPNGAPILE